jgi:acyl-CoA synthetase (AMP-forming)/AMP-acid ligase II
VQKLRAFPTGAEPGPEREAEPGDRSQAIVIGRPSLARLTGGLVNLPLCLDILMRAPFRRDRLLFRFDGESYTYRQTYERSQEFARFFLVKKREAVAAGKAPADRPLAVGVYQENRPELLFALLGAAFSDTMVFALNTGLRGKLLAEVIDRARLSLLLVDTSSESAAARVVGAGHALPAEAVCSARDPGAGADGFAGFADLGRAVAAAAAAPAPRYRRPLVKTEPLLVIYTSGTTGVPKGVPCLESKLLGAAVATVYNLRLTASDRGYIAMPLYHANALFLGLMPLLLAGGSFVLKRRFSASAFEDDILREGVTYLNYVGQPLHYIIRALETRHGGGEAVTQALARDPRNRLRIAHGNGASGTERAKLTRYLGMEHVYELYGSSEAVIATVNRPGDPIESVGRVPRSVVILDAEDRERPPGVVDDKGRLLNPEAAIGEIAKKSSQNNLVFDGYYEDDGATGAKFRGGYFRSGDLGHIRVVDGVRYLFFDGRTDDWIRKDGENFSAEGVRVYALDLPGVELAAAYGVPGEISDQKVMVALQLAAGARFDPDAAFAWYQARQLEDGMDPKWMPDYIRIVEGFALSETQKIQVTQLRREHFHLGKHPEMEVYERRRGDTTYHRLTPERFAEIERAFAETGRSALLG